MSQRLLRLVRACTATPFVVAAVLAAPAPAAAVATDCPAGITPLADRYWNMEKLCESIIRDVVSGQTVSVRERFEEAQRFPPGHADPPPVAVAKERSREAKPPPRERSNPEKKEQRPGIEHEADRSAIAEQPQRERRGRSVPVEGRRARTVGAAERQHARRAKPPAERPRVVRETMHHTVTPAITPPPPPVPSASAPTTLRAKPMASAAPGDGRSAVVGFGSAALFGAVVMFGSTLLARQLRGGRRPRSMERAGSEARVAASSVGSSPVDEPLVGGDAGPDEVFAHPAGTVVSASPRTAVTAPSRAKVQLFGPVRVTVGEQEVSFGRAEGRDLFALLAASKEGEPTDSVIERLWPDEVGRGNLRLETGVRDVNAAMRHATRLATEVKFVVKVGRRRRLSAAYFDVDWWQFQEAYVRSHTGEDEAVRVRALREMLALYQGPLLADRDDLWSLPLRHAAETQAVNAAMRLAENERKRDPGRALDVLTLAVDRVDRYNEVLWCQIMTVQAELGRLPAVRWAFQQLTERLAEIDLVPSRQARQTYQRLVG
ncbi:BTAD domain-containing putative transcriptional regulator [Spongiactinospora sp. TRM90649]|uniref:AfsR/SARP family transcriptional regulator n=1 Tax=Spongiactinospora sp. TRM90649 TaxID=3031114 RepID=UPI0023F9A28E|nr:BTAD domain-containing putative transcriptional regulator [Spongiactinospora sp. TRM90649]MDF5758786.1 BTAD domain-containing putative transcriptional regulator [Spongiactinospora sp. TRM90649]